MSDNIARAQDILRDMRAAATPGPWIHDRGDIISMHPDHDGVTAYTSHPNASLIVVLAGNPAFLDALDGMLGIAVIERGKNAPLTSAADRIAAAVVAAWDEAQS